MRSKAVSQRLHLTDAELAEVQAILCRVVPDTTVWAFGSRAHGRNLKPFSDLDLAIVDSTRLAPDAITALEIAFAESDLPFRVDMIELAAVDAEFRQRIEAEHRKIAGKNGAGSN